MPTFHNPALSEEPQSRPLKVSPPIPRESLLGWLDRTGRLKPNDSNEVEVKKTSEDIEDILGIDNYAADSEDEEQEQD